MEEFIPGDTTSDLQLTVRVVWRDAATNKIRDRGTFRDSVSLAGDCTAPEPPPPPVVTYQVTGSTATVDVTYENENGDASQAIGVPVPWTYSFDSEDGAFLYVSAQKDGSDGAVTCSLYVDGVLREANTSTGAYAICTSSDTL